MFKLSQENLNKLLAVLGEIPAKMSYDAIQLLASLEKIEVSENEEELKEEI